MNKVPFSSFTKNSQEAQNQQGRVITLYTLFDLKVSRVKMIKIWEGKEYQRSTILHPLSLYHNNWSCTPVRNSDIIYSSWRGGKHQLSPLVHRSTSFNTNTLFSVLCIVWIINTRVMRLSGEDSTHPAWLNKSTKCVHVSLLKTSCRQ